MAENKQDEAEKPIRFLLVDPSDKGWDTIVDGFKEARKTLGPKAPAPTYADTVRSSQSKLSDRDFAYAAIFVNPSLGTPAWTAVVRSAHQYRAGTPVFMIYDKKPAVSKEDAQRLGLRGALAKPLDYPKMLELVSIETEEIQLPTAEESAEPKAPPAPPSIVDDDYTTVDLRGVIGRLAASFDLYARLSNQKYVKILNAGDTLSRHRVEGYLSKGMNTLFILKTAQAEYLKFFDQMTTEILKDDSVAVEVKVASVAGQGAGMLNFMKSSGLSGESVEAAHQYVNNTTEVVSQMAAKNESVKALLADALSYDHSVACTTFAGLMLKHIGGQNPTIFNAIGIACFLHDISLVGHGQALIDEDESKMTPAELEIFRAHPDESAKVVKKMKGVPPIAATAVAQHHLRINKQGFPVDKVAVEINRIAELIGLSEAFLKLMKRAQSEPNIDPFNILRVSCAKDFSPPLVDAFIRTFKDKLS